MNNQGDYGSQAARTRNGKPWIPPPPLPAHLSPAVKLIYDQRLQHSEGYYVNNTHSSPYGGALNASPIGFGQANPYSTMWFPSPSANVGFQFPVYLPTPPPAHQNTLLQRSLFHHVPDNVPFTCFPRTTFPNLTEAHLHMCSIASWVGEQQQKHAAITREIKANLNGRSWAETNVQVAMGTSMSEKLDLRKKEPLNVIESTTSISELGGGNGGMSIGLPVLCINNNSNRRACVKSDPGGKDKVRVRRFECLTCGKRFGYKSVLQYHERTHTREKPFQCVVCKRSFSRDHHLLVHGRLHTGERPLQCPECDRRFAQEGNVRKHVRVRSDPEPNRMYFCTRCSSRFRYHHQLKRHMVVHSDIKLFHCEDCGEGYVRHINLIKHKSAKHGSAENPQHRSSVVARMPISSSLSQVNTVIRGTPRQSERNDNLTGESTCGNEEKCGKRDRKCRQPRQIIRVDGRPVVVKPSHVTPIISDYKDSLPVHNSVPVQDQPNDLSFVNCTIRVIGHK